MLRNLIRKLDRRFPETLFTVVAAVCWSVLVCLVVGILKDPTGRLWWFACIGAPICLICALTAWWYALADNAEKLSEEQLDQMRAARHQEIQECLVRRVSPLEAESLALGESDGPWYMGPGAGEETVQHVRDFIAANVTDEEDELWLYDYGQEAWDNLGGEWGFAVLRRGEVTEFTIIAMN